MAKKQSLSYGPNMGLIAGEAQVAKSEAGLSNSVGAFAQGFIGVFGAFQKQEEERAAKMEAYNAQVPSVEQINFIEDPSNKQIVRTFLNKQRDEYSRLAEIFEKTKDRGVRDKMEEIKFSLVNLNDQIKVFNEDKNEYRTAFDENQLADGRTFNADFFTNAFTNNGELGISENGDMGFNIAGKNYLYKDNAGKWNNKNNISEEFQLSMYSKMLARGESGKEFYSENVYNAINNNLKSTGTEGIQALATTDLTGDNSTMSFEQQWASGSLDKKFYQNRKKGTDTSWMFESKNSAELRDLMSTYYTDVMKDGHGEGKKNYKDPNATDDGKDNYGVPSKGLRLGPMINGQYQQKESQRTVISYIEALRDGTEIQYQGNEYTFYKGKWIENRGIKGVEEKIIGSADDMRKDVFQTMDKSFMNIETSSEERIDHATGKVVKKGDFTKINFENINDFSSKTGINKELFQKRPNEILDTIKSILPDNFDVGVGKTNRFAARNLFRSDSIEIYKDGEKIGEYPVSFGAGNPVGARNSLEQFFNDLQSEFGVKSIPGE
tara:strand:- start:4905 stop:6551 length:1647 start_codon:yes stop_codon:yes gene_type:complete